MRKALAVSLTALSVVLIHGCSSQPTVEEKPGVEDRIPGSSKPVAPPGAGTQGAPSGDISAQPLPGQAGTVTPPRDPLKDPASVLSKRSVFFDFDSVAVKDEFRPLLQAHARYLSDNRGARMLIQGHADERGSREYNIALGQRRSDAVKRLLVLLGAQESQVEAVSLGEEKPRCEERTDACYAQNRRADLLYGGEY